MVDDLQDGADPGSPRRGRPPRRPLPVKLLVGGLALTFLLLSIPGALRDVAERGGLYIFSWEFLEDIPRRLTGPGRLRFLFQPTVAALLGWKAGRKDRREGRPPFLLQLLRGGEHRAAMVRAAFDSLAILMLMGILLDTIAQWLIFGISHPGAAIVVGPVLISVPYAVARIVADRGGAEGGRVGG